MRLSSFWRFVEEFLGLLAGEFVNVSRLLALLGKPEFTQESISTQDFRLYMRSFRRLLLTVIIAPIALLFLGSIGAGTWLVALAGLIWTLALAGLLFVLAPFGLAASGLKGGFKELFREGASGVVYRYLIFTLWTLLVELTITLFFVVVPTHQNLAVLPGAIITGTMLSLLAVIEGKGVIFRRVMWVATGTLFAVFMIAFFLPETYRGLVTFTESLDRSIKWLQGAEWLEVTPQGKKLSAEELEKLGPTRFLTQGLMGILIYGSLLTIGLVVVRRFMATASAAAVPASASAVSTARRTGERIAASIWWLFVVVIWIAVLGAAWQVTSQLPAYREAINPILKDAGKTYPFCTKEEREDELAASDALPNHCWLTINPRGSEQGSQWMYQTCRNADNKGIWYWPGINGGTPRWIPPNRTLPVPLPAIFHVRGEGRFECVELEDY